MHSILAITTSLSLSLLVACAAVPSPAQPASALVAPWDAVACATAIHDTVRGHLDEPPEGASFDPTARWPLDVRVRVQLRPGGGLAERVDFLAGSGDARLDAGLVAAVEKTTRDPAAQAQIAGVCTRSGRVVLRFKSSDRER
jgi:hypothetical protein